VALTSTVIKFHVDISDVDRGVYDALDLKVAQHPSEENERLIVRLLGRCLAHEEGLEFGRGLSTVEDPAMWIVEPGDQVKLWIDVGAPSADRLHKASKRADRVVVFTDKDAAALKRAWSGKKIHKAGAIEVVRLPRDLVDPLAASLGRSLSWTVTTMDGGVTVTSGDDVITAEPERTTVEALSSS
jgi:uncharacterized protein YaeQ